MSRASFLRVPPSCGCCSFPRPFVPSSLAVPDLWTFTPDPVSFGTEDNLAFPRRRHRIDPCSCTHLSFHPPVFLPAPSSLVFFLLFFVFSKFLLFDRTDGSEPNFLTYWELPPTDYGRLLFPLMGSWFSSVAVFSIPPVPALFFEKGSFFSFLGFFFLPFPIPLLFSAEAFTFFISPTFSYRCVARWAFYIFEEPFPDSVLTSL